jgi:deferrochelatase/peroxidase EfeB
VAAGAFADDRLGLAVRRPPALVEPPPLPGDEPDARWQGGDLCLVVSSDDLQSALHAVRNLVRVVGGGVALRWTHVGFGPPAGGVAAGDGVSSHRDLLGFREGTATPRPGSAHHADAVWVTADDGPPWMVGGTYLVARRITLDLAAWEGLTLLDRERVIGRHRRSGAPLGEIEEAAPLDLAAEGLDGRPLTDPRSHVAVAHRASEGRRPLARRSYNVADGVPQAGGADSAGLLFLAHCRDPRTQYLPVLEALANEDLLATYARTTASLVAAVLPGLSVGESWSDHLWA